MGKYRLRPPEGATGLLENPGVSDGEEPEAVGAHPSSDAFPVWRALIEGEQLGTVPEMSAPGGADAAVLPC